MTKTVDIHASVDGLFVLANIPGHGIIDCAGATLPTDGDSGYAVGCLFRHLDGGDGTALYVNEGTESSCDFNAITVA